jgi:uncharacterized protein (DUF849 family)
MKEPPFTLGVADDARHLKAAQRLAQSTAADLELNRQLALGWQLVSGLERAVRQLAAICSQIASKARWVLIGAKLGFSLALGMTCNSGTELSLL